MRRITRLVASLACAGAAATAAMAAAAGAASAQAPSQPTVTISAPKPAVEGNTGSTTAKFPVRRTGDLSRPSSVLFEVAAASASDGVDFRLASPTSKKVEFGTDQSWAYVTVAILGDAEPEMDETFQVHLYDAFNAAIPAETSSAVATIVNDEALPGVSISDASRVEGDAGSSRMRFTATLDFAITKDVHVDYATVAGSASHLAPKGQRGDYANTSGRLVFPAGRTTPLADAEVAVYGDTGWERTETFSVSLSNPFLATLRDGTGTGGIVNDDARVDAIPARWSEGDAALKRVSFRVNRRDDLAGPAIVRYAITSGTAEAADCRTSTPDGTGEIAFTDGDASKEVYLDLTGNLTREGDETVLLTLTSADTATIMTRTATGTIVDDDIPRVSVSAGSATVTEADGVPVMFAISLDKAVDHDVTVRWHTEDDTAVAGRDYTAASGTKVIGAGARHAYVNVLLKQDALDENLETFRVVLDQPAGATIGKAAGLGFIGDDDEKPRWHVPGDKHLCSVLERDPAGGKSTCFAVIRLDRVSGRDVTFTFTSRNVTPAATQDVDYSVASRVTISAGQAEAVVWLDVLADDSNEDDEYALLLPASGQADPSQCWGPCTDFHDVLLEIIDDD